MSRTTRKKIRRKRRLYGVVCIVFLLAAAGVGLYRFPPSLQDIGRFIRLAADKNNVKSADVMSAEPVLRGTVFDRALNELAVSYSLYSLQIRPSEIKDQGRFVERLSPLTGLDEESLAASLKEPVNVLQIMDNLSHDQAAAIRKENIAGVYLKSVEERFYPEHQTAASLIGYTGENIGLAGVEAQYEMILQQGEFRSVTVPEIDFQEEKVMGRSTLDVVLTLDLKMQEEVENTLLSYLNKKNASRGFAVLMNTKTGAILAWAASPSLDPNYFWQATKTAEKSLFEETMEHDLFDPILIRAAAVRKNGEQGDSLLPLTVAAPRFGLQENEIKQYGAVVGLYEKNQFNQIPVPISESSEQQKSMVKASANGLGALQLAVTAASLVNGGWKVTPYVLDSVYDHSHEAYFDRSKEFFTAGRRRVMSPAMGILMRRELLHQKEKKEKEHFVYTNSVSKMIPEGYTSRYVIQDMLLGFIPVKSPKFILLIASQQDYLNPQPKRDAKKKLELEKLGSTLLPKMVALDEKTMERSKPNGRDHSNYNRFLISRRVDYRNSNESEINKDTTMPQVTGLSLRKGLQRLNGHKLKVRVEGSGRIVTQYPEAGTPLNGTGECILTLASNI